MLIESGRSIDEQHESDANALQNQRTFAAGLANILAGQATDIESLRSALIALYIQFEESPESAREKAEITLETKDLERAAQDIRAGIVALQTPKVAPLIELTNENPLQSKSLERDPEAPQTPPLEINDDVENRLKPIRAIYERDKDKAGITISWEETQQRFLENGGFKLRAAEKLKEAILYGIDKDGKLLFANGMDDVTRMKEFMGDDGKGLTYGDARKAVMLETDSEGNKRKAGLELFPPIDEEREKSLEIKAFEKFTGKPFVKPDPGETYCETYLESGETPSRVWACDFLQGGGDARVHVHDVPVSRSPRCGVRCLLRV